MTELRQARKAERQSGKRKLFPARLTDIATLRDWACCDADSGRISHSICAKPSSPISRTGRSTTSSRPPSPACSKTSAWGRAPNEAIGGGHRIATWRIFRLVTAAGFGDACSIMSATEATAEIFVTAFKALKPKEREAVWQKLVMDTKLAEDLADTLALEARRQQRREPFRDVLKALKIRV